jgi:SAM-dependent methyltransferase
MPDPTVGTAPILDETQRIADLALRHPEILADAVGRLDRSAPSILYHRIQVDATLGSAPGRGTPYGERTVDYAREFVEVLKQADLLPDTNVRLACAGCGDGTELEEFERQGYVVEGFDLDAEKVRIAQYCGLKAKVGDVHQPPLTDGLYDGVFCSHTLEHTYDLGKACAGLAALLKPRGCLFIVVPLEGAYPTHNPSHFSPIARPEVVLQYFNGWEALDPRLIQNREPQAILVLRKPAETLE